MIKYDLHLLGWNAFQQLCHTVTREILGQSVESFLDTNDAGKDGAFTGIWKQKGTEDLCGKFVIQCKFTNKSEKNLTLSDLADEFKKIKILVANKQCDTYILMTNAGVSGRFHESFTKKLQALGVRSSRIFGSNWLFTQIHENKRLRMLVPRVYGLGDLSQILDERSYAQAKQLLHSMRDDLSKIVITTAYHKAASALSEHGFVLIIGEPAAGKTTIASLLAMAAVDQWDLLTLKLDSSETVIDRWNPDDPNQFFWIDDAFGTTQYESDLVTGWNHKLSQIKTMLNQGIKIVMTSRNYIYERARNDLKDGAFPLFKESQVVIDLHKLTQDEKEQILYNHLKLGRQSPSFIKDIKPYLVDIASHYRFTPETARRLADPAFTNQLKIWQHTLMKFVEDQESLLVEVIRGLDKHSKAALALIYMNNGQIHSPIILKENEFETIRRLGSDEGNCFLALEAMNNSLVQYTFIEDNAIWRFKHPTIGDAYSNIISKSPEQLELYLQGTDIEKVMEQVTCGDVGLEKTIIVPKPLFSKMTQSMLDFKKSESYKLGYLSRWGAKRKILTFLARRCSKDFIELYFQSNTELLEQIIKPGLSFSYSEEIDLVIKLNKLQLLSEPARKDFVDYISGFTISGEDMYLLKNHHLQEVFKDEELSYVKKKIKDSLVPTLASVRLKHESEYRLSNTNTSEEHMDDFLERLNILIEEFTDHPDVLLKIEEQFEHAKTWVEENQDDDILVRPARKLDTSNENTIIATTRSIFDDIDDN